MRSILVDAGPLIALFDKDDRHHAAMRALFRDSAGRLITTWPVVTETSHMLDFDARAQLDFFRWVAAGGVVVHEIPQEALGRIIELVEKYGDRPMDLADATLVVAAEALGIHEIVSIDRDFEIYRIAGRVPFVNLYTSSG
ncbi:MAG: PIN domain-containing protein [Acidimicrobiia bacterium]